jgi:hypothetical protein
MIDHNATNPQSSGPQPSGPQSSGKYRTPASEPGAMGTQPVGAAAGAAAGAAVGAAGGMVGGPAGAIAGAAVGAVVGGLAGLAVGEAVNPTVESKFWQDNHASRPYSKTEFGYPEFEPAYRYGWESHARLGTKGQTFELAEQDLRRGWERAKGASKLKWDQAKLATRDAWDRVSKAAPGAGAPAGRDIA